MEIVAIVDYSIGNQRREIKDRLIKIMKYLLLVKAKPYRLNSKDRIMRGTLLNYLSLVVRNLLREAERRFARTCGLTTRGGVGRSL